MYTGSLTHYYGKKFIHKESGRTVSLRDTELFVKVNDFGHEWVQSVSYVCDDNPNATFVRSVDSFRAAFEEKKEGEQDE